MSIIHINHKVIDDNPRQTDQFTTIPVSMQQPMRITIYGVFIREGLCDWKLGKYAQSTSNNATVNKNIISDVKKIQNNAALFYSNT